MFGIYIHIPFCIQKCAYCDFVTAPFHEPKVPAFLDALHREIELRAGSAPEAATSVFFGGGTPSLLRSDQMRELMSRLRQSFAIATDAEITVEANPGTLEPHKLESYRRAGINRLSIGAQTFDDGELSALGREHTAADTIDTVRLAREAGFDNISLDLIFGVPSQTLSGWRDTLDAALRLESEHMSVYGLTVEPRTVYAHRLRNGALVLPDDDAQAAMYEMGIGVLEAAGLLQYEISNFAQPGRSSRHNRLYWDNDPHIGLGPGAWSYVDGVRSGNLRSVSGYVKRVSAGESPVTESERLEGLAHRAETLTQALRQREGITRQRYSERCEADLIDDFGGPIANLVDSGLLEWSSDGDRLRLTRRGMLLSNEVFMALL